MKNAEKASFETWMQRLEALVNRLENQDLPLDEVSRLYDEGMELSDRCQKYLKQLEEKMITVSQPPQELPSEEDDAV